MPEDAQGTAKRNRSDHVLPEGYLDGFSDRSNQGQVCVFDRQQQRWFDTGTARVGAIRRFYDHPQGSEPDETADPAFAGLEAKFPVVTRELVSSDFSGWVKQRDLLLSP